MSPSGLLLEGTICDILLRFYRVVYIIETTRAEVMVPEDWIVTENGENS